MDTKTPILLDKGIYKEVHISEIDAQWDTRKRKQYNNIEPLSENILTHGLFNPLTVMSESGNAPYILLAGGRRLKALTHAKIELIPVHVYDRQLSEYEMRAIELYENHQRSPLPYAEEVEFIRELNEMFQKIHGAAIPGKKGGGGGHSMDKTAKMLGTTVGTISTSVKLANAMKKFPELELSARKNKAAALKALQRFEHTVIAQADIARAPVTPAQSERFIVGDFFDHTLKPKSFQFLEVDPPYAIDAVNAKKGDSQTSLQDNYHEIPAHLYPEWINRLSIECYKLASDNAWIVMWCGPQWLNMIQAQLTKSGWSVAPIPGIWKKGNSPGQTHSANLYLGSAYEMFIYARKGSAQIRMQGRSNIYDFAPISPKEKELIHPMARPVEMIKEVISTFCWPGYSILVPFAGGGNTLEAAEILGYQSVGFDKGAEFQLGYLSRRAQRLMNGGGK